MRGIYIFFYFLLGGGALYFIFVNLWFKKIPEGVKGTSKFELMTDSLKIPFTLDNFFEMLKLKNLVSKPFEMLNFV